MLKISLFEFFFRAIPELIMMVFYFYIFSLKKINIKKIFVSSIILSIIAILIRLLPIQNGMNTILLIPVFVFIARFLNDIPVRNGISSVILGIIILSFCEFINIYILTSFFKINIEEVFQNVILKTLYGSLSLGLFLLILVICYFTIYKRKVSIKFN